MQEYAVSVLSRVPALSSCPFISENSRDVEYEIKKALGKEGIVGLVMTPKARFVGRAGDIGNAWQCELEIDVVESPTVNRGRSLSAYCTGEDAALMAVEALCPCEGEDEGKMCPVSFEQGEDGGLVVNKVVLKCIALPDNPRLTVLRGSGRTWKVTSSELTTEALSAAGVDPAQVIWFSCGPGVSSIGDAAFLSCGQLESFSFRGESIGTAAFRSCSALTAANFGSALTSIGDRAFCFDAALTSATFAGSPPEVGERGFYGCWDLSAYVPKATPEWEAWGREQEIPVLPLSSFQS